MTPVRIGNATLYLMSLMRSNYEAVGFIPFTRLEQYLAAGQVLFEYENGEPCGYLVYGNGWPILRVYQACIQYDARRIQHGLAMVARLERIAIDRRCEAVRLRCANDLPANLFWRAAGFEMIGTDTGGMKRGRLINIWLKRIEREYAQLKLFPPEEKLETVQLELEP